LSFGANQNYDILHSESLINSDRFSVNILGNKNNYKLVGSIAKISNCYVMFKKFEKKFLIYDERREHKITLVNSQLLEQNILEQRKYQIVHFYELIIGFIFF
jgi:hypothetical protein